MVQVTPPPPSARAGSLQQSERTRGSLHFVSRRNALLSPSEFVLAAAVSYAISEHAQTLVLPAGSSCSASLEGQC